MVVCNVIPAALDGFGKWQDEYVGARPGALV